MHDTRFAGVFCQALMSEAITNWAKLKTCAALSHRLDPRTEHPHRLESVLYELVTTNRVTARAVGP